MQASTLCSREQSGWPRHEFSGDKPKIKLRLALGIISRNRSPTILGGNRG
jgi:hypothetical protein